VALDPAFFPWSSHNKVSLQNVEYEASLGVYPFEKQKKQTIRISCDLYFNFLSACLTDELSKTLDYDKVQATFRSQLDSRHFGLIESLAYHLVHCLLEQFPQLSAIRLKVEKPQALAQKGEGAFASVEIYQEQSSIHR
jgi:dihydroneopterin aldolase